jgi:hypothetical protein
MNELGFDKFIELYNRTVEDIVNKELSEKKLTFIVVDLFLETIKDVSPALDSIIDLYEGP